ncbi:MAG: antibiotic biosynthesis monooxygenase [Pseudomonadota bacterium]
MYSVAFIFKPGELDDDFHVLDQQIERFAESLDGFVGKEVWHRADNQLINSTYCWRDEASLKTFSRYRAHLRAKKDYQRWYQGFHIVVSKVERSYGDGAIDHLTPNDRDKRS